MPGRMDAAHASPVPAWMAINREQNDHPLVPLIGFDRVARGWDCAKLGYD